MTSEVPTRRRLMKLAGIAAAFFALPARADSLPDSIAPELVGKKLRVIKPGQMVTMDYSDQRANVEIDENELIKRIYIG